MKILFNYNYDEAPITTAYYVEEAAKVLGHDVTREASEDVDLALNIEPFTTFARGRKTVLWELDSYRHVTKDEYYQYHGFCDLFATASAPHYAKDGAVWLPVAADGGLHRKVEVEQDHDVVFVGRRNASEYPIREHFLNRLSKEFKTHITTSEPGIEYSKQLSRGKIIFNCSAADDINMRFFEGMAIGCLVTNYLPHQFGLATPYKHYVPYRTEDELIKNIEHYLNNPEKISEMSSHARDNILKRHTYWQRLLNIIDFLSLSSW